VTAGKAPFRVLVVGEALVDVVRHSEQVDELRIPGGGPANVARGLGRLDVPTRLLTHIAPDDDGMAVLYELLGSGVNLVPGSFAAAKTPTAEATIDASGRATYRFDVSWALPPVEDVHIPEALHIGSYGAFVAPGADHVRDLAIRADREGARVSFDPNIRPGLLGEHASVVARFEELAGHASILKLSDEDAEWLYPDCDVDDVIKRLEQLGAPLIALTRGAEGSILAARSERVEIAAIPGAVADTVGAGDSYMSALIAFSRKLDLDDIGPADLGEIGRRAGQAAAVTVGRQGSDPPWTAELQHSSQRRGTTSRR
jgi:fructokinase